MDFLSTITNPANILEGLPPQLREAAAVLGAGQFWPQGNPEQFLERANAFLAYAQRCEVAGCSGDVRGAVAALDGKMKAALLARWEKLTSDDPRSHLASKIREAYLLSDVSRNQGLNIDGTKLEITLVVAWWLIQFITLIALALWLRSPSHRKKVIELLAKTGLLKAHLNHKKRMAEVFFPLLLGKEVVTESLQEGATQLLTQKIQAWNGTRDLVGFAGKKYGEVSTDWQQIDDAMFWGAIGGAFGGLAQGWFMQAVAAKMRKSGGDASFEGDLGRLFHPAFATKLWAAQALDQGITQGVVNAFLPVAQGQPFKVENLLLGFASGVFTGGSVSGVTQHVAGQLETAHAENPHPNQQNTLPPRLLRELGVDTAKNPSNSEILNTLYQKLRSQPHQEDPDLTHASQELAQPGTLRAEQHRNLAVAETSTPPTDMRAAREPSPSEQQAAPGSEKAQDGVPPSSMQAQLGGQVSGDSPTSAPPRGSHSAFDETPHLPQHDSLPAGTKSEFITAAHHNPSGPVLEGKLLNESRIPAPVVPGPEGPLFPTATTSTETRSAPPSEWAKRFQHLNRVKRDDPDSWELYKESLENGAKEETRREVRALFDEILGPDFLERTGEAGTICVEVIARYLDIGDRQFGKNPAHAKVHRGTAHAFVHSYHQGLHFRSVLCSALHAAAKAGCHDVEILASGVAAAAHDVVQDHGRGADENMAAALAADAVTQAFRHDRQALKELDQHQELDPPITLGRFAYLAFEGVRATTFDENARTQSVVDDGDESSHRVQVAVATGDLLALCQQDGPYMSLLLSLENLSKKDPDNPEKPNLMAILLQREGLGSVPSGEAWKSPYDIFGIIDELASEGNSQLRDAVIADLRGSLEFYDREKGHQFPHPDTETWWTGRDRNRALLQRVVWSLEDGARLQDMYVALENVANLGREQGPAEFARASEPIDRAELREELRDTAHAVANAQEASPHGHPGWHRAQQLISWQGLTDEHEFAAVVEGLSAWETEFLQVARQWVLPFPDRPVVLFTKTDFGEIRAQSDAVRELGLEQFLRTVPKLRKILDPRVWFTLRDWYTGDQKRRHKDVLTFAQALATRYGMPTKHLLLAYPHETHRPNRLSISTYHSRKQMSPADKQMRDFVDTEGDLSKYVNEIHDLYRNLRIGEPTKNAPSQVTYAIQRQRLKGWPAERLKIWDTYLRPEALTKNQEMKVGEYYSARPGAISRIAQAFIRNSDINARKNLFRGDRSPADNVTGTSHVFYRGNLERFFDTVEKYGSQEDLRQAKAVAAELIGFPLHLLEEMSPRGTSPETWVISQVGTPSPNRTPRASGEQPLPGPGGGEAEHEVGFAAHEGLPANPGDVRGRPGRPAPGIPGPGLEHSRNEQNRPAEPTSSANPPPEPVPDTNADLSPYRDFLPVLHGLGIVERAEFERAESSSMSASEFVALVEQKLGPCPPILFGLASARDTHLTIIENTTEFSEASGPENPPHSGEVGSPETSSQDSPAHSRERRVWAAEYDADTNTIELRIPEADPDAEWTFNALCDWHRAVAEKVLVEKAMELGEFGRLDRKSVLARCRVQAEIIVTEHIQKWYAARPLSAEAPDSLTWARGVLSQEYYQIATGSVSETEATLKKFVVEGRIDQKRANLRRNDQRIKSAHIYEVFLPENWHTHPILIEKTQHAYIGAEKAQRALALLREAGSKLVTNPFVAAISRDHIDDFLYMSPRYFSSLTRQEKRNSEGHPQNIYTNLLDLVNGPPATASQTDGESRSPVSAAPEPVSSKQPPESPKQDTRPQEPQEHPTLVELRELTLHAGIWHEIQSLISQLPSGFEALFYAGIEPALRHAHNRESTTDLLAATRNTIRTLRHPEMGISSATQPFTPAISTEYNAMIREISFKYGQLYDADLPWPMLKQVVRISRHQPRLLRKFWLIVTDSRWEGALRSDSALFQQVLNDHQTLAKERNKLEDVQLKFQLDPMDSPHMDYTLPARGYPERVLNAPDGAMRRLVGSTFQPEPPSDATGRENLKQVIDPRNTTSRWSEAGVTEFSGKPIERRELETASFSYLTEIDRAELKRFGPDYKKAGETADRYACDGAVFLVDELDDPESTLDILARAYRVNPELVARAVEARNRVAEGINLEESAREQLASLDKIVRKAMRLEQNEARGHLQLVHDRTDLDSTTRAKLGVIEPGLHPASDLQRDYLHTHIPGITEPNRNEIALRPWQLLAGNPVDFASASPSTVAAWADHALQRRTEAQLTEIARRTGVADRVNARLQSLSEAERGLFLERMAQKFLQYPYWLDPKHLAFNPDSATWHPDQDPASPMHSALDVEILSAVNAELQSLRHPDLFDARGLDTNFRDMEGDLLAWADNANTQQENPRRLDEDTQRAFREATTYLGKHAPERIRQFWLLTQQHGLSGTVQDNPALFAGAVIEAQLVETTRQTAEDGLTPAERAELAEVRNRSNVLHAKDRALRAKWPGRDIESVGERGALKNENAVTTVASWTRNGRKFLKAERADRTRTLEQLERTYFFNPDLVARALSARHQAAGTEPEIALTNPLTMQDAAGRYLLDQVDPRAFTGPEPRNAAEEAVLIRSVRQPRSLSSVDSSPESSGLLKDTPAGAYRVLAEKLAFFGTIRGIRRQLDGLDVLRGLWSELQDASSRHPLRVRFLPFTESSYASLIESRKLRDPFSEVAALADGEDLRSIIVAPDQGGTIFDLIPALVEQYFYPDPTVARNLKNELSTEQFWYYSLQNQKQREIYGKLYQRHALAEFLSHGPGAHEERLAIIQQFHSEFWNTREQALISPETVTRQSLKKYERKDQPGVYSADTHRFVQQLADFFTGKNVTDEAVLGAVADSPHRMAAAIWREKAATYGILNEFGTNPQLRWAYVDLLLDPEAYRSPAAFRQLLRKHGVDPHERTAVPEGTSTPDTETIRTATSIQFLQRHLAENPATEEQVRLAKDTIEAAANRVLQNAHDTQETKRKKATVRPGEPVNYDYKEHAFSEKLEKIQAEQELRENFLNQIYSELKKHFSEPGHLGAIDGPTAQRWNKQLLPEALLLDEFVDKVYRAQIPLNTALIGVKLAPADNDTPPRSPDTLAQRVVDLREAGRYISPPNSAALSMADLERHVDFLFSNALRMDKEWTQEIFELTMKRHEQFSSADDHAYLWFWLDRRFWAEPAWNTVGGNRPETPRVGMWHPPQQDAARDERPQDFPSWDKNASVRHLRTVSRFIDNAGLYQDDPAAFRRFVQEEALREFPDVPGLRRRFES